MQRYIGVLAAIVVVTAVVYQYRDKPEFDDQEIVEQPPIEQAALGSGKRAVGNRESDGLVSSDLEQTEETVDGLKDFRSDTYFSDRHAVNREVSFRQPLTAAQLDDEPYTSLSEEEKVHYQKIVSAYDEKVKLLSEAFEENLKNPEMRIEIEAKMAELQQDVNIEQYREAVIKLTKDQLAAFTAPGAPRAEQVISNAATTKDDEHRVQ